MKADKFEALTDEELSSLADRMGLDLPADLERVFVIEEILEALEEENDERRVSGVASLRIEETKFANSDTADLYFGPSGASGIAPSATETFIRVLVRDPSWAFAFWEIADAERQALAETDGGLSLVLRVTESAEGERSDAKRDSFDIPVHEDDGQWYINMPRPKARYRVELCSRHDGKTRVLAKSRDVVVPRHHLDSLSSSLARESAELLRLSGLESLDIEPAVHDNPQRILKAGLAGE